MWWDKRKDSQAAEAGQADHAAASSAKWLLFMLLAFLGQGLAGSSQKVLIEAKAGEFVWQFYVVLYWTGFTVMLLLSIKREPRPHLREFITALVMAVCSVVGNVSITSALNTVKGVVAFPVANGGSLTLVVLAGVLFFRERIHPVGVVGIVCGITAVLVLVLN